MCAAFAVSGVTSNLLGKSLENIIKNIDLSGGAVYQYSDYGKPNKSGSSKTYNGYEFYLNTTSKVNKDATDEDSEDVSQIKGKLQIQYSF